MNTSKCYQLFLIFDKKDLNYFEDFVQSPFFNKNKSVIRLYQWLKKHLEHPTKKTPQPEAAYHYIFPDKKTKETLDTKSTQTLNRLMSRLYELAIDYVKWKKLKTHKAYGEHIVLQEFLDKRADKLFELHFNKHCKNTDETKLISLQTYHDEFLLAYDYAAWNFQQKNHSRENDNIQSVSHSLTLYYLIQELHLVCHMLTFSRLYKISYNFNFLPHLLSITQLPQFRDEPVLQIYLHAIQMLREEKTVHFEQFKHLLNLHETYISKKIQIGIYVLMTNFCTRRIIAGEGKYLEELFQLYQAMSAKNLLTEGKYIPIDKMKNIISVGCKLKHFEWTREFIESNQKRIVSASRDSVYHFGMGAISFYQNDLKTAVHHLIRVEDIGINYTIDGKFLMMKAYYQLDEDYSERTERIILSFIAYIKQNRILSAINKQGYINFTKTLHSLYRIKHKVGKRSLEFVENRLQNYTRVSDKKWLLEKIGRLK